MSENLQGDTNKRISPIIGDRLFGGIAPRPTRTGNISYRVRTNQILCTPTLIPRASMEPNNILHQ